MNYKELFKNLSALPDDQLLYEYQALMIEKNIKALTEWDEGMSYKSVEDLEVC